MTREDIRTLYLYNDWANDRLMTMLAGVFGEETDLLHYPDERVRALHFAVVHTLAAQFIWRERWAGRSPTSMLPPEEFPTVQAIRRGYEAERECFWQFFVTLEHEEDLQRVVHSTSTTGEPRIFPLWQMMLHVVNHGSYHRGQVTARLLDMGYEDAIRSTDLIFFYQEQNQAA